MLRETYETPSGKTGLTGTMLRRYPGGGRYTQPNWKVSVTGQPKFTGPDGEGYPTPQFAYWNQPGSAEEILNQMNGNGGQSPDQTNGNGGQSSSGGDDSGPCACGEPDPDPFGSEDDGDPFDFGAFF
jgi:hypothetical protein